MVALQRQLFPAPAMAQFDEWPKLLRPIARNSSADGEDPQALLAEQSCGEIFEIFEGIKTEFRAAFLVAFAIVLRQNPGLISESENAGTNTGTFFS